MNDIEFGSVKLLRLKYRREDQIIQTFCKIGSPQKLGPPSLICRNFKTLRKVVLNMQNALKSNEWRYIWVNKTFKTKIQKRDPNNPDFLQNWFPPEIRFPLSNLNKSQSSEESTRHSCSLHWNLMNDDEFGCTKLLKFKHRRAGSNNTYFLQNWFAPQIRSLLFNL